LCQFIDPGIKKRLQEFLNIYDQKALPDLSPLFLFGSGIEYRYAHLLMVPMKRAMNTKSPFPGVGPYLEQHWGDIHTSLMGYLSDQLLGDLQARIVESVCVDFDESPRRIYPDVSVIELPEFGRVFNNGGC